MNEKQYLSIERLLELSEEKLEEPRRTSGNYRHKLVDVFVISLLGIMTGLEDWIAIEDYANAKQEWLKTFLELPNGAPSNDTYRRVFERLKPDQIESVYREWVMPYIGGCAGKQIAIDGKTICGASAAREKNEKEAEGKLHMISAWICEDRISIAQVKTNEKSNEITKIPELLSTLDVRGSVVTIDAMGTQTAIAKKIVEEEADYVLGLKQNQPTLYRDVKEYFDWARTEPSEKNKLSVKDDTDSEHGRITHRHVEVSNDVSWLEGREHWKNLSSLICVTRKTERDGNTSTEESYYIASRPLSADEASRYIRAHWSIENQLHWSLDVVFHEDDCQIHSENAPQNLSVVRKIAKALLQNDTSRKISLRRKSHIALMDNDYAFKLLFGSFPSVQK